MRPGHSAGGGAAPDADQRWKARTQAGLAAFQSGRIDEAYAAWRSAAATARAFDADDPRRATSRTHLALCHAASGGAQAARRAFGRALLAWDAADAWTARMAIPERARSSGFHLRLERKHPGRYDVVARTGFVRLFGAGRDAALAGGAHLFWDITVTVTNVDQPAALAMPTFGSKTRVGLQLRWQPTTDDGEAPVTMYELRYRPAGDMGEGRHGTDRIDR